jgi:hypothetical protein
MNGRLRQLLVDAAAKLEDLSDLNAYDEVGDREGMLLAGRLRDAAATGECPETRRYLVRFDAGPDEQFDAADDAAAAGYVRELLSDRLADDDDTGSLYRLDEGGRGEEEYLCEVSLGEGEED